MKRQESAPTADTTNSETWKGSSSNSNASAASASAPQPTSSNGQQSGRNDVLNNSAVPATNDNEDLEQGATPESAAMEGIVASSSSNPLVNMSTDDDDYDGDNNNAHNEASAFLTTTITTSRVGSRRGSSLELRKLPVNVLLRPEGKLFDEEELSIDDGDSQESRNIRRSCLQRTCLNSKFTLRSQMMLSFGVISACTILLVVIVCIGVSILSGKVVKEETRTTFDEVAGILEARATRYIAEDLTPRLIMEDVVQMLYETTKDRFYGYPVYEDDSKVPFFDTLSQSNKYPITGQPLPLDWQIEANVNEDNFVEHVQKRWHLYSEDGKLSTTNAVYLMQGMCDPSVTDSQQYTYLPNCTNANNDLTTGGVYTPSPTNAQIHRKASDLGPILKALYEYHQDLKHIGVYFSNSGAGSAVVFPGLQVKTLAEYTSIGCEWLKGPHPLDTSRPILSQAEIDRCTNDGARVEGANISARLFSPLDRAWCRDQVQHPNKIMANGPYLDVITADGDREHHDHGTIWLMTLGRSIFDPITNELIGCIGLDVSIHDSLSEILWSAQVTNNSHVSVVHWNSEATVVASSDWDLLHATETVSIDELDVGVSQEAYEQFYGLVDYSAAWNATEVRQAYEEFGIHDGGFQVKAYPIPPIPETYEKGYEPTFLVLFSVSEADLFSIADDVDDQVDARVTSLIILSVAVGAAGLVVIFAVIFAVSHLITQPLREMNDIAVKIIDNFGEDSKIEVKDSTIESRRGGCIRTELSEIVKEFERMVRKFAGGSMARSAKYGLTEVDNQFQLIDDFRELYASRSESDFTYKVHEANAQIEDSETTELHRLHHGSNLISSGTSTVTRANLMKGKQGKPLASPLFRWIVTLIVLPLLLSTMTISIAVLASVSQELPDMVKDAENGMVRLQVNALEAFAHLRAGFVSRYSEQPIRDLHLLTRYTSWILFGALQGNETLPQTKSGTEDCKYYNDIAECPWAWENHVCDCTWNSQSSWPCDDFSSDGVDSRFLQVATFAASSQDNYPNGDRNSTSFPLVAYTANTTAWWQKATDLPGAPEGGSNMTSGSQEDSFAPGYATTYARLRSTVVSPILIPLYNYDLRKESVINNVVSFEGEGLYVNYRGCEGVLHAGTSQWVSTEQNGAARLRPELCPLGKYGYDARCRGWYDQGRKLYMSENGPLYVTPPYLFADGINTAQSCTSPLFDPNTKEHVGQTLVDFRSNRIFESLDNDHTPLAKGGFHLLITTKQDSFGADVVIGPGVTVFDESVPLAHVVKAAEELCHDGNCFHAIANSMKAGESGTKTFVMEDDDNFPVTYHIAYSPVVVKSFRQVNSSDFSRGVELEQYKLYSVALVEPEASMLESFEEAEEDIRSVSRIGLAVLSIVILAALLLVVWLSRRITISMAEPMHYLLELIRHINRLEVGEDPPEEDLKGGYGSAEVFNVQLTMEKLYKIIQCANAAYFAGETEVAYEVFADALRLFTRLENKKAMGVANNNLGNVMLTLYRTMEATGEDSVCGFTRRQIIGKGMAYFHQAIQLGEKAYDSFYEAEGWSPNCLHFMQHLSNRYFNRAMFLLTVQRDHEKPKEIEELGKRDLQIARDMDVEIVDEGTQAGWNVRSAEEHMEVLLGRTRGHITLLEMGYPDEWEVDEMLDNAFKILKTEAKKDGSPLFADVGPAGRMQQVEFQLMRYNHLIGEVKTAAQIAIRMLVEDEFIFPEVQKMAVEVLVSYAELIEAPAEVQRQLIEYQKWLEEACDEIDTQRSSKDALETAGRNSFVAAMPISKLLLEGDKSARNSVASLRESLRGDITMEAF